METDWTRHWESNYGGLMWNFWRWRIKRAYRKLLNHTGMKSPTVLELGSGSGANSIAIAEILNSKEIMLVDMNEKALEISKKLAKDSGLLLNLSYIKQDILSLDLGKRFDIVHSEGLIEHFYGKERLKVFGKHVEFCREGGFVIIFVPNRNIIYSSFRLFFKMLNRWIWDEKALTKKQLRNLCAHFGLKIIKEYTSPLIHEMGVLAKK
ncbi:MAG: class I SAM-dependent methyltransferase [Candidatus Aenigmatarchaeota archaeon]